MSSPPAKSLSLLPNDAELVFGLVGPLGANLTAVERALKRALEEVSYKCETIRLSEAAEKLARDLARDLATSLEKEHKELLSVLAACPASQLASPDLYEYKMNVGNRLRRLTDMPDALALLAVLKIRDLRRTFHVARPAEAPPDSSQPIPRQAYVVHQLKRPEEIETLRRIYGDAFILLSVYSLHKRPNLT